MRSFAVVAFLFSGGLALGDPPPSSKELTEKGRGSFNVNCVPCHGPKGLGDGVAAIALNPKPRNYTRDAFKNGDKPEDVFKTVTEGIKNTTMVGFAHLPESERWGLAHYVLELRKAGRPSGPAGAPSAPATAITPGPAGPAR